MRVITTHNRPQTTIQILKIALGIQRKHLTQEVVNCHTLLIRYHGEGSLYICKRTTYHLINHILFDSVTIASHITTLIYLFVFSTARITKGLEPIEVPLNTAEYYAALLHMYDSY